MKYVIEIQEEYHKIKIENTNAELQEFLTELFRALAKIYRTVNAGYIQKTAIESIKKAYAEQ